MSLSASYSAVNPLWSFEIVDRPRPLIAKFGTLLNFITGGAGGNPISLSELDSSTFSFYLFFDSINNSLSAYCSGVMPFALFDTVESPSPSIASFGIKLKFIFVFLIGIGGGNPVFESLLSCP